MLRSGMRLLRESGRVLLEAAPRDLDPQEIGRALAEQNHVVEVHDLHVWEVTSGFPAISAHVTVRAGCDTQAHRRELAELLRDRFGVTHSTLQVETRHEGPLTIEPLSPRKRGVNAPLRDPAAPCHEHALRLPARGDRHVPILGGSEGPLDGPARQAVGHGGGRPLAVVG